MSTKINGRKALQMNSAELGEMAQGTGKRAAKARRELERRAAMVAKAKSNPRKPDKPQSPRKKAA